MTKDEIIRMARDAGFSIKTVNSIDGDEVFWFTNITDMLERFATIVATHEREACAKVCEEGAGAYVNSDYTKGLVHGARLCAAAIRVRGEK